MQGNAGGIKVLVVDDSAVVRGLLARIVNGQPDMQAVGAAPDPLAALEMIHALNPDVITLDVEMPRMDGLEFLERLMRLRPMPVVMVSTLTEKGSDIALRALELGAVDFISKPKADIANGMQDYAREITDKIRVASKARLRQRPALAPAPRTAADPVLPAPADRAASTEKLIMIGASTGGTEAIKDVLAQLPADCPGVLITQHMPEAFTRSFAARLDSLCRLSVKEAAHGERVLQGHAYVAPGHSHLLVRKSGAHYVTELSQGPPVNRHRPSVDVLFRSAAHCAGRNALGVILTGMGRDGAAGMREMKHAGCWNVAQNEATCVVFGMPKEAIASGGVDEVLPLSEIPRRLMAHLATLGGRAARV